VAKKTTQPVPCPDCGLVGNHCKHCIEGYGDRVVTCVSCGYQYETGTPQSQDERLTAHIKVCEKHPMRVLEKENEELKRKNANLQAHLDRIMRRAAAVAVSEGLYEKDLTPLSPEEQEKRRPPPPETLVNARQERVHEEPKP
jgi:hypothetical protein